MKTEAFVLNPGCPLELPGSCKTQAEKLPQTRCWCPCRQTCLSGGVSAGGPRSPDEHPVPSSNRRRRRVESCPSLCCPLVAQMTTLLGAWLSGTGLPTPWQPTVPALPGGLGTLQSSTCTPAPTALPHCWPWVAPCLEGQRRLLERRGHRQAEDSALCDFEQPFKLCLGLPGFHVRITTTTPSP